MRVDSCARESSITSPLPRNMTSAAGVRSACHRQMQIEARSADHISKPAHSLPLDILPWMDWEWPPSRATVVAAMVAHRLFISNPRA